MQFIIKDGLKKGGVIFYTITNLEMVQLFNNAIMDTDFTRLSALPSLVC